MRLTYRTYLARLSTDWVNKSMCARMCIYRYILINAYNETYVHIQKVRNNTAYLPTSAWKPATNHSSSYTYKYDGIYYMHVCMHQHTLASISVPFSNSNRPISACPPSEAACNGIIPTLLRAINSAPALIRTSPARYHVYVCVYLSANVMYVSTHWLGCCLYVNM